MLAKVRSGKHLSFNAYRHELDDSVPSECPRCGEDDHTMEHWIRQCPATQEARQYIFGEEMEDGLPLLTRHPAKSVALARRLLPGAGQQ